MLVLGICWHLCQLLENLDLGPLRSLLGAEEAEPADRALKEQEMMGSGEDVTMLGVGSIAGGEGWTKEASVRRRHRWRRGDERGAGVGGWRVLGREHRGPEGLLNHLRAGSVKEMESQ